MSSEETPKRRMSIREFNAEIEGLSASQIRQYMEDLKVEMAGLSETQKRFTRKRYNVYIKLRQLGKELYVRKRRIGFTRRKRLIEPRRMDGLVYFGAREIIRSHMYIDPELEWLIITRQLSIAREPVFYLSLGKFADITMDDVSDAFGPIVNRDTRWTVKTESIPAMVTLMRCNCRFYYFEHFDSRSYRRYKCYDLKHLYIGYKESEHANRRYVEKGLHVQRSEGAEEPGYYAGAFI